jgi:hypothetical protein
MTAARNLASAVPATSLYLLIMLVARCLSLSPPAFGPYATILYRLSGVHQLFMASIGCALKEGAGFPAIIAQRRTR